MVRMIYELAREFVITDRVTLEVSWKPRTKIGKLVKEGKITSIDDIFRYWHYIPEPEIVDWFLQDLKGMVLESTITHRMTDSGRRYAYRVTVAVGNENGYIGVASARHADRRMAILKAIMRAKKNLIPVIRGCGSWECRCGQPHSIPMKTYGKCGAVRVVIIPGPRGLGLVAGDIAKHVLRLAGIRDAWTQTFGPTKTNMNFAKATYDALARLWYLL